VLSRLTSSVVLAVVTLSASLGIAVAAVSPDKIAHSIKIRSIDEVRSEALTMPKLQVQGTGTPITEEQFVLACQRPPACAPPMVGSCAPPRMCVSRCSRLLSGGLRDRFLLGVGLLSFGWARGVFAGPLPVAFAGYDGHSGVVCESVEGCGGQERIPEYLRPLGG
jgi:hypothetical protein